MEGNDDQVSVYASLNETRRRGGTPKCRLISFEEVVRTSVQRDERTPSHTLIVFTW